ncbi:CPXCG motif-containing cysteine-rich protein [Beggiatoa alba]|nr:CPXCG motif-containing cysteine-rich protein [Beggiatoa alba]
MISDFNISCPYCGEVFHTVIDYSAMIENNHTLESNGCDDYTYVEDCQICCQPILFTPIINADGNLIDVITRQENE